MHKNALVESKNCLRYLLRKRTGERKSTHCPETTNKERNTQHSNRVPFGHWKNENTQREALESLGREQFGVQQLDDWYSVNSSEVINSLSFIGSFYKGSLWYALQKLYPQHNWDPLRFSKVPRGYWNDEAVQREALERIGREQLGVKKLDDWYRVPAVYITNKLSFLQHHYNYSLFSALQKLYPHHNWNPLRFSVVPRFYWKNENVQRDALERLGVQLGVKELDDWYTVSIGEVTKKLKFIKGDFIDVLKRLYPHHEWDPLRFSKMPHGYWKQPNTLRHYQQLFTQWKQEHNIQTLKEWFELQPQQLRLVKRVSKRLCGSIPNMLKLWFPDTQWSYDMPHNNRYSQVELQMMLKHVVNGVSHRNGIHSLNEPKVSLQEQAQNQWVNTWSQISSAFSKHNSHNKEKKLS